MSNWTDYPACLGCELLASLLTPLLCSLEEQLAAILAALGRRRRLVRAAAEGGDGGDDGGDDGVNGHLLTLLKEAFVVSENCIDFDICNG